MGNRNNNRGRGGNRGGNRGQYRGGYNRNNNQPNQPYGNQQNRNFGQQQQYGNNKPVINQQQPSMNGMPQSAAPAQAQATPQQPMLQLP